MAASMTTRSSHEQKLTRTVEFYSGVGGMHYAIKESGILADVVAAIDINDVANKVYRSNFPEINLLQKNIQSITMKEFMMWSADMFVMSPPCQPFTRNGLKGDNNDHRTDSFFHLIDMLPKLPKKPTYILVENVKGFETSHTRSHLTTVLSDCGYIFQEFLISPTDLGIANQRLRYFLLAKLKPNPFVDSYFIDEGVRLQNFRINQERMDLNDSPKETNICSISGTNEHFKEINSLDGESKETLERDIESCLNRIGQEVDEETSISSSIEDKEQFHCQDKKEIIPLKTGDERFEETNSNKGDFKELRNAKERLYQNKADQGESAFISKTRNENKELENCSISQPETCRGRLIKNYLEPLSDSELEQYILPDQMLSKFCRTMDIQTEDADHTCCFTKAYGHYVQGTGSFLQTNKCVQKSDILRDTSGTSENLVKLRSMRLRYFTPREVANFHCFPQSFAFPDDVTRKQRYRVLGNSLNAHVVAVLLKYLTSDALETRS